MCFQQSLFQLVKSYLSYCSFVIDHLRISKSILVERHVVPCGSLCNVWHSMRNGTVFEHCTRSMPFIRMQWETTCCCTSLSFSQVYRCTADVTAGEALYSNYSSVTEEHQAMRDIVLLRKMPRRMFVQPHTRIDDGEIEPAQFLYTILIFFLLLQLAKSLW